MDLTRRLYQNDLIDEAPSSGDSPEALEEWDRLGNLRQHPKGNLTSSRVNENEWSHLPVIDLDIPVRLVPSRTDGCFHLYIDKPTNFDKMVKALEAMREAGWVEPGYVQHTKRRGAAFVRTEGTFAPHARENKKHNYGEEDDDL